MTRFGEEGPNDSNMLNLKMVINIYILYPYSDHIPQIIGGVSHSVTERAEYIHIKMTSTQEADNVIPTIGPVNTILGQSN